MPVTKNLVREQNFILGLIIAIHIRPKIIRACYFSSYPILLLAHRLPRVSLTESAAPRMEDDSSEDIVDFVYFYLIGKGYPPNCTLTMKRQIRQRSSMFVVVNGELHYKKGQDQVRCVIAHTSRLRLYRTYL